MDRTAVVALNRLYVHPLTRRIMRHTSKYFCHDAHEVCGVGDRVQIKYCGAISKNKRYTVVDIVARHPQLEGEPFPMSRLVNPPSAEEIAKAKAEVEARILAAAAEAEAKETADVQAREQQGRARAAERLGRIRAAEDARAPAVQLR
jgi:small subunit ribosomal protein S17